jgi:PAS domain S-box-containing protein
MINTLDKPALSQKVLPALLGIAAISGLYASSLYSYLLFHTLIELFSIVVSFAIFILAWNTRRVQENHYLLYLGISLLFIGTLEMLHTLAYKGFGVFPNHDANLPTQLWIAFRYLTAFSFLGAPLYITRKLNIPLMITVYTLVTSFLIGAIFLGLFPDCFIEGRGLTPFKITSEYAIISAFLTALGLLVLHRKFFDSTVLRLMAGAIVASVLSELSFTQYASVFGLANMIGHFFLLASMACLYQAIVVTGIVEPGRLLFRNLTLSEEATKASEAKYRSLFENMIDGFAFHKIIVEDGGKPVDSVFLEMNNAFEKLTGLKRDDIIGKRVTQVLPGIEKDPADWIGRYGKVALSGQDIRFEQHAAALGKWFSVASYSPMKGHFATVFEDITERKQMEEALHRAHSDLEIKVRERTSELARANEEMDMEIAERMRAEAEVRTLNRELEQRVTERTAQLEATNRELEAFSYSVSHDLRAPLRTIDGFSKAIEDEHASRLDDAGRDYFKRVRAAAGKMAQLIDALLELSRMTRGDLNRSTVDLSILAKNEADELAKTQPGRKVEFLIPDGITAEGDSVMLRPLIANLIGNAWKFTSKCGMARIEFGVFNCGTPNNKSEIQNPKSETIYFVRDNGAGFDMAYADKLFTAFQRLHRAEEFPGIGIGLATAHRVVRRHNGRMWAESEPDKGAVFYFTL